jgi:hypothetical protein
MAGQIGDNAGQNPAGGTFISNSGAAFTFEAFGFERTITGQVFNDSGPGDNEFGSRRVTSAGGGYILYGVVEEGRGSTIPTNWFGHTDSITRQYHTGVTEVVTVRVIGQTEKRNTTARQEGDKAWSADTRLVLTCEIIGRPVQTGMGSNQVTTTDDKTANTKKQIYTGTSAVNDPQDLQSSYTVQYIVYKATDTLAADFAMVETVFAALSAPEATLKKRTGSTRREHQDLIVTLTWGLTNTKDDIEKPGTTFTIDQSDLASTSKQTSVFNEGDSNPAPVDPSEAGLTNTTYGITSLNDGKNAIVYGFEKDSTQQKAEQATQGTLTDGNSLDVSTTVSAMDAVPASPGGSYVLQTTKRDPLTHDHYRDTATYGLLDTAQMRTFPGTFEVADPLGLDSTGAEKQFYNFGGSVPSANVPSGQQKTGTKITRINRIVSSVDYSYEVLNSEQKRGFPHQLTTDDANNIEDKAVRYKFWTVGGSAPSAPDDVPSNNVKVIDFTDVPVSPTRNMRLWVYGPVNSKDKHILGNYENNVDASGLKSAQVRACLDGETIIDPVGYVLRETRTELITATDLGTPRTVTVKVYGLTTHAQDIENEHTFTVASPESPYETETSTIVAYAGTAKAKAQALNTANQATTTYLNAKARKLNSDYVEQIVTETGDVLTVQEFPGQILEQQVRGIPASGWVGNSVAGYFAPGNVQYADSNALVRVRIPGPATGAYYTEVFALPLFIRRARTRIAVRRRLNVNWDINAAAAWANVYLAIRATVADNWFLGHAPYEVMFVNNTYKYCFSVSGSRSVEITSWFLTDNWKHFGHAYLPCGRAFPNNFSIQSSGLYSSRIFDDGMVCDFPPASNFLGFIS